MDQHQTINETRWLVAVCISTSKKNKIIFFVCLQKEERCRVCVRERESRGKIEREKAHRCFKQRVQEKGWSKERTYPPK